MNVARSWGTSEAERALPFASDAFVPEGHAACWRGVTVRADAPTLFRWLCQLRAAPYSYDWIDNFGRRSPRTLTPGLDELAVGQRVMQIFELVAFERDRHLTLLTRRFASRWLSALAVTYALHPVGPRETRLLVKLAIAAKPGRIGALATHLLAWGDLVMMRRQLLNLRDRAEGR